MAETVKKTGQFFRDVVKELKRVSWPTRKELTRYTGVVVATVIFIAVFFAIVDLGISSLVRFILG
ncbi:preprotein translocase subunit SecE [Anaerobacillus isosaccharinicus]|uniref:Protein translocase subunit SecE n=1 Tax=Anaerobacillus isosaccharinicus TaxID=1532552 RepID=A0A1S2MEV9_9BACI|nr:preprotein translocase subunit SecE [Anaerobacillus isosaccharinicus]MBA5584074.1 preprotein translocase subunit SecE [Anaerobacillus isosaccharinicus]QOY37514.1 preprotein translocase subunit SecE [Anaerobacillus isosaccharinicus]